MGYARRNFLVPVPRYASWAELNAHLLVQCQKRRERKLRGHQQTIGERFEKDKERLLPLPPDCAVQAGPPVAGSASRRL